jgi:hypothetical protein
MKLHLGCGDKYLQGFVNIDIRKTKANDVIDNIFYLSTIEDSSAEVIYASHVLEHVPRNKIKSVLKLWNKKLKKGGTLRISVPSFEKVVQAYNLGFPMQKLLGFLVGGQKNRYDYHKMVFDFQTLKDHLENSSFANIREYDWRKTEHFCIDDYSQAYLPHMEKESGIMMSLNVEAEKI